MSLPKPASIEKLDAIDKNNPSFGRVIRSSFKDYIKQGAIITSFNEGSCPATL